jgi:hypothetical protein
MDSSWNEVLYSITKGDPGAMQEMLRFDVFDFFAYIENNLKRRK